MCGDGSTMLILVTGGAGSGKSAYAEELAAELAEKDGGPLVYLATMLRGSGEAEARIAKHRKDRAGKGFRTIERALDLGGLTVPVDATVLLEDLGNLLGNEMFFPEGNGPKAVLDGIRHVKEHSRNMITVGNEVFSDGQVYGKTTEEYRRELAMIQRTLAEQADRAVEVICGCPNILK